MTPLSAVLDAMLSPIASGCIFQYTHLSVLHEQVPSLFPIYGWLLLFFRLNVTSSISSDRNLNASLVANSFQHSMGRDYSLFLNLDICGKSLVDASVKSVSMWSLAIKRMWRFWDDCIQYRLK